MSIPVDVPDEASTDLFAHDTGKGMRHFFAHPDIVRMCGDQHPIVPVRVVYDPKGAYWAWWDAEKRWFTMIYPAEVLVEMCFPYGSKAEESRGRGKLVNVRIDRRELPPA